MKSWLQDKDTKMYSTHKKKKKFLVAKKTIRTLKSKICKYLT